LRLDPFTIFLDENHSRNRHILKVLAQDLDPAEKVIRAGVDADFPCGMLDENWLPIVGLNGWIVVSADTRIWRRSVLREVLFRHGVRGFFFTENNLRGELRAAILRSALPEMRRIVRETPPPFVASLTVEGHAHVIFDNAKHRRAMRKEMAGKAKTTSRKTRRKKRLEV
jgi:PIN like domain